MIFAKDKDLKISITDDIDLLRERLENFRHDLNSKFNSIKDDCYTVQNDLNEIKKDIQSIKWILRSMRWEQLENDVSIAAAVIIPYRGDPIIVKDGKSMDAKDCDRVTMMWDKGDSPRVEVDR